MPRIPQLPFKIKPTATDLAVVYDSATATTSYSNYQDVLQSVNASSGNMFSVMQYGAKGDGVTDDSTAIQAAITAAQVAGGGTVFFPQTSSSYLFNTGLIFTLSSLTSELKVSSYGGQLKYGGAADAITVNTNIASNVQSAQSSLHWEGLNLVSNASATSGIKLVGASFCSFRDTVLDGFTSLASNVAALVIDASFTNWCEENNFTNLEIRNTGFGICFISENDSGGVASSCANNHFTNTHIWVTQTNGKGIYGVGKGATSTVQISRSNFETIVVHVASANNVIAYDLSSCTSQGVNFLSPSVDITGACASLTGWNYAYNGATDIMSLYGPTAFPSASLSTWYTGGGSFNTWGGNLSNPFKVDVSGNITGNTVKLTQSVATGAVLTTDSTGLGSWRPVSAGTSSSLNTLVVSSTASIQSLTTSSFNPSSLAIASSASVNFGNFNTLNVATAVSLANPLPLGSGGVGSKNLEQFLYPAYTSGNYTSYGAYMALALATNVSSYFNFTVPQGVYTAAAADVFLISGSTTTLAYNATVNSSGNGSGYQALLGSLATTAFSATLNNITTRSVLGAIPTLVAGNVVGMQFTSNTSFIYMLGLRIRYQ